MTGDFVRVCPKCKSTNISYDNSDLLIPAVGTMPRFVCQDCDFTSNIFPEIKKSSVGKLEKTADLKSVNESNEIQLFYGKFIIGFYWKLIAPFMIVIGLALLFFYFWIGLYVLVIGLILGFLAFRKTK